MNARKPSKKGGKPAAQEAQEGFVVKAWRAAFGDLFAHGIAMPLLMFGVSTVLSIGGVWAWLETAKHEGDLATLYKFAAALTFFAQWIANCAIMRVRATRRFGWIIVYFMAASMSGFGVYHMSDVARSASYQRELQAQEEVRRPYNAIITENTATRSQAQQRILEISQRASAENWPGERTERQSAPTQGVIDSANTAISAAQAQLAALGPPMPATRPRDFMDLIFAIFSLVAVLLEGKAYFNMTAGAVDHSQQNKQREKRQREKDRRLSIREVFAMWLARQMLGTATAAALVNARAPAAPDKAPIEKVATANNAEPPIDLAAARAAKMQGKDPNAVRLGELSGLARAKKAAERAAKKTPANDTPAQTAAVN